MMKAGTYYIGDLCYVMTDSEWDEFCDLTIKGEKCLDGEFTFKDGRSFATYGTLYGDGGYHSNIGTSHSVDAGLIGCIRVEDIRANKYEDIAELGAIHTFVEDFQTSGGRGTQGWNGTIKFGSVEVYTGGEEHDCGCGSDPADCDCHEH